MKWLIICVALVSVIIIILIVLSALQNPQCGSNFNPNLRYCNQGQIVVGQTPIPSPQNHATLPQFLQYMSRIQQYSNPLYDLLQTAVPTWNVYKGILMFAIPELLRLLPTDFGQNQITPYGIISFFDLYKSCISDPFAFCEQLLPDYPFACVEYLKLTASSHHCPFSVTDSNASLYIADTQFFNYIGLLGAISLNFNQVVVMFTELPLQDLDLNYWSLNVYVADNLNPDALCSPFRQTYAASIVPPLNMFTAVAISKKQWNPLTGEGTKKPGYVRFYTVIALDSTLAASIVKKLPPEDFVHIFEIPAGKDTMILDNRLPNPNRMTPDDPMFDPSCQRLACFLRLSPRPDNGSQMNLQNFIYRRGEYQDSFHVCMVENDLSIFHPFRRIVLPPQIAPIQSEMHLKPQFMQLCRQLRLSFANTVFHYQMLQVRPTILNVMSPMYTNILNTKIPYRGGYQAIQLAGNAQADNYDANYCLSEGVCLLENDILLSCAVNHSRYGNCIYNNINIVDINKAYGYASIELDQSSPYNYYIILVGRNHQTLVSFQKYLQSQFPMDVSIQIIDITTGSSSDGNIPMNHQMLLVERVYINLQYQSITNSDVVYNLQTLFGSNLQDLVRTNNNDAWDSLQNVTAPQSTNMLKPVFFKLSYVSNRSLKILVVTLILLVVIIVIIVVCYHLQKK